MTDTDPYDHPLMRVDHGHVEAPDPGNRLDSIYKMQLWGLVFPPLWFVACLRAERWRNVSIGWQRSHFDFIHRGLLIAVGVWILGILTAPVVIGFMVIFYWYMWAGIRAIQGRRMIARGEGHPNPRTWSWHTALGDDHDF